MFYKIAQDITLKNKALGHLTFNLLTCGRKENVLRQM